MINYRPGIVSCNVVVLPEEIIKSSIIWQEGMMAVAQVPLADKVILVAGSLEDLWQNRQGDVESGCLPSLEYYWLVAIPGLMSYLPQQLLAACQI